MDEQKESIVELSGRKFLLGSLIAALIVAVIGIFKPVPPWLIAGEVMLTILALFILGSIKYRLDKNALTYGAVLVIGASFWTSWWAESHLRQAFAQKDFRFIVEFVSHHFFTLHGLDALFHADTMLFILGLTFFVAVIAQTRLLESLSFLVLKKNRGALLPTVAILAAIVSVASGILDGVSMIGLMIRTLVIILFLAKADDDAVIFSVVVSTVITTVCGMWLAYGEPPNLIMKANLHPHLTDGFFLRYCLPVAVGSYFVVYWNLKKRLKSQRIEISALDTLDLHTADVRFLQASKHGEVLTPVEFVEEHEEVLAEKSQPIVERLQQGEPLGAALVRESVPEPVRKELLGKFIDENLADSLDRHYAHKETGQQDLMDESEQQIRSIFRDISSRRLSSQKIGAISFVPFIGFLVWHALNHSVPLFWASFAGFAVAFCGILGIPKMRRLALQEARHEFSEYLFLFPLFFSITLLQKTGFFAELAALLRLGIERVGASHLAYVQFVGATVLSALLDNNVVADFTSRALHGLDLGVLHLFAMAQIAGYAVGGCWTHIGSAQSVVAYSFLRREVNEHYTPFQWIKIMTPIILEIFLLMTVIVYGEGLLLKYLQ